ncbi:MAG: hypothetical protein JSW07_15790 [bacterium]|nr:MAG: hypothetical protein JSW07_15790 [bacterium]
MKSKRTNRIVFFLFIVGFGVSPPLRNSSAIITDSADILIRGSITDSESGQGIDSVKIDIANSSARAFTRKNGQYEILVKKDNNRDFLCLFLDKAGYTPEAIFLKINKRDNIDCSIQLKRFYYGPYLVGVLNFRVKGKILSRSKRGGIIANALITAAKTLNKTYSYSSGNFNLAVEDFGPSSHVLLWIEKEGYKPQVIKLRLQEDKKTYEVKNVYLQPIRQENLFFNFYVIRYSNRGTHKTTIDSALIIYNGDTLDYTQKGRLRANIDINPDQHEIKFDCSHRWFQTAPPKKVKLDERTEYPVSIELSPLKYSAEVHIFDDKNSPVKNASITLADQPIGSTDNNGLARITFHAIPEDTFQVLTPKNFYAASDTFIVFYPERKVYFLNIKRKLLQARFAIIDSKTGRSIAKNVKIISNAEDWTHIATIQDTLVCQFFAKPGDKVACKIEKPDYNAETVQIRIDDKKSNYRIPRVALNPKIYYGYLKIRTHPDSVVCKIIGNDGSIKSLISPNSLRLPENKYKLILSKEYYDSREDSIEILRNQINLKTINLTRSFGILKLLVKAEDENGSSVGEISIKNNITAEDLASKWNKKNILSTYQINEKAYFGKYNLQIRKKDYVDVDSIFTIQQMDTTEITIILYKKRKDINFIVDPPAQYHIYIDKSKEVFTDSSGYVRIPGLKLGNHEFIINRVGTRNSRETVCAKNIVENQETYRAAIPARLTVTTITNPPIFSNLSAFSPTETRERRYFLINMRCNYSAQLPIEERFFLDVLLYFQFQKTLDVGSKIPTLINLKEGDFYVEEYQPFLKFYLRRTQLSSMGLYSQLSIPYISKNRNFSRGKPNIELRLLYSRKDIFKWAYKNHLHINFGLSSNRIATPIKQTVAISDYSYLLFGFKYELYLNKDLAFVADTYSLYSLPFNQGINSKISILCQWRLKPTLFVYAGFNQKYSNLYGDEMPLLPYEKVGKLFAGLVTLIQ